MSGATPSNAVVDDRLPRLRLAPHAAADPSKIAVTMADGSTSITFSELESRSSAIAAALGAAGLRARDRVAILMENRIEYLVLAFAAQRSGLLYVPVNWHLTAEEAEYIVCDSEATVLFSSARLQELADRLTPKAPNLRLRVLVDAIISASSPPTGWTTLEDFEEQGRSAPTPPAIEGQWMFYSSGTTGRPKGIVRPPTAEKPYGSGTAIDALLGAGYGFDERSVYLSAAPQYHAAPLGWSMGTLRRGGSVVVMEKFEPLAAPRRSNGTE